ncbi:MAG: hypothetical protein NT003_03770 [Candidatus Magasanikbacteria bacterium]|nr:hypothetical protein [Candidatus Magasanikbacteria bacterium]
MPRPSRRLEMQRTQEKRPAPMNRDEFFDALEKKVLENPGSAFELQRVFEHNPEDAIDFFRRFPDNFFEPESFFFTNFRESLAVKHPDLYDRICKLTRDAVQKFPSIDPAHLFGRVETPDLVNTKKTGRPDWQHYMRRQELAVSKADFPEVVEMIDEYYSHQLALREIPQPEFPDTRTPAENIAWSVVRDRVNVMNHAVQTGDFLNILVDEIGEYVLPSKEDLKAEFADQHAAVREYAIDDEKRRLMREFLVRAVPYEKILPLEGVYITPQEIQRIFDSFSGISEAQKKVILKRVEIERWLPLDVIIEGKQAIAQRELSKELKDSLKKRGINDDRYELQRDSITKQYSVDWKNADGTKTPNEQPKKVHEYKPEDPKHLKFETNYGSVNYWSLSSGRGELVFVIGGVAHPVSAKSAIDLKFTEDRPLYVDPDEPIVWMQHGQSNDCAAYHYKKGFGFVEPFNGPIASYSAKNVSLLGAGAKKRFISASNNHSKVVFDMEARQRRQFLFLTEKAEGAVGNFVYSVNEIDGEVKRYDVNDWNNPSIVVKRTQETGSTTTGIFSENKAYFLREYSDGFFSIYDDDGANVAGAMGVGAGYVLHTSLTHDKLRIVARANNSDELSLLTCENGAKLTETVLPPFPAGFDITNPSENSFDALYFTTGSYKDGNSVIMASNRLTQQCAELMPDKSHVWSILDNLQGASFGSTYCVAQIEANGRIFLNSGSEDFDGKITPEYLKHTNGSFVTCDPKLDRVAIEVVEGIPAFRVIIYRGTGKNQKIEDLYEFPIPQILGKDSQQKTPALTAEEQEKLDLLNVTVAPTEDRVDAFLKKYARPDLFPKTVAEREAHIKERALSSRSFMNNLREMVKSAAGNLPLARELFKTLAATSTSKNELLAQEIVDLMFPELPILRAQKAADAAARQHKSWVADTVTDAMIPQEETDLIGGGLRPELKKEKTVMFELREPYKGLIVQQRFDAFDAKKNKWLDQKRTMSIEPSREMLHENTISIPVAPGLTETILPCMPGGHVIADRVKARFKNGEWSAPLELDLSLSAPSIKIPRGAVEIVFSVRYPTMPALPPEVTNTEYVAFSRAWQRNEAGEFVPDLPIAQLPPDCLLFVNSIESLAPHERVAKIQEFVQKQGFYDFDNDEVRAASALLPLTEQFQLMRARVRQLSGRSPELAHALKGKMFAGKCGDFAQLTYAMFQASGLVGGVTRAYATIGGATTQIFNTNAHGTAWAAFPAEKKHEYQPIYVDATPHAGTPGHEQELAAIQLPTIAQLEEQQEEAREKESERATAEFEKIVETLNAQDP